MKSDNYKITQYSVGNILAYVENSQIAIPEIQRPFVWKGEEVRALIDSLYEGYPIGYLIVWQNSQVRVRDFGRGGTKKILIDGQQRVTALMTALLGKKVLDAKYQSHQIRIAFNPLAEESEDRFAVCKDPSEFENDPKWIPDISIFFRRDFSFRQFEKEYKKANPGEDFTRLEDSVDTLKQIVKHQVGVIELSFLLDIDVVSEIFIRINLQGKPLNQEDFVMSKISVNEQYGGDEIRNCIDYFCHLLQEPSFYEVLSRKETAFLATDYGKAMDWCRSYSDSLYIPAYADVLKVVLIAYFGKTRIGDLVNLLSGKTTGKREVSKGLSEESFRKLGEGVRAFVSEENFRGFQEAIEKAGYCCGRLIYSRSLINYCYAMYLLMDRKGVSSEKKASLIGKWITMCMLTGHYQNAGESTVVRDCEHIEEVGFEAYLEQIEQQNMSEEFYDSVLPEKFAAVTTRTAPFLAYLAMQCAKGTHALYSRDTTIKDLCKGKAESWQILPKSFLEKCGCKARSIYAQAANITYISPETRQLIKRKAPSVYRDTLLQNFDSTEIEESLAGHSLTGEIFAAEENGPANILAARRRQMAEDLHEYYRNL